MRTETKSKVLFSTLILAGMSPSCYLLSVGDYVIYGLGLLALGIGLLAWLWWPRKKHDKK